MADGADALIETVRAADRDRYLALLYAPEASRPALAALYAFDAEIASVRDRISMPLPGEIRLEWWREVVSGVRPPDGHPVAVSLLAAISAHGLPVAPFEAMLEARIFDLYDDPMPSRTDLEGYCGETASAVIQLASMVLDRDAAPAFAGLAGHAGCAQGIAGLLARLLVHRARRQCYVPRDLLEAAGTDPDGFLSGAEEDAAARAVAAMAALGRQHQRTFADGGARLPRALRPAYLPLAPADALLERIERRPAAALTAPARLPEWRRHWLMVRRASRGW